jgi:hypothetical protein
MSNIISIPLNKLTRSARNVRKSGGESIDGLATSILVHGLIHNLTVVEQQADKEETGLAVASLSYRSESTPYLINWLVGEPGAAGFGSKGVPVVGIKGSVAARAKGASKEATVRTVAARTIDAMCVRIVSQSDPKPDQRASTSFVGH